MLLRRWFLGILMTAGMASFAWSGENSDGGKAVALNDLFSGVTAVDDSGNKVSVASFEPKKRVLAFVYVNCRKTCPMALQGISRILEATPDADAILITLDYEHDVPKKLREKLRKRNGLSLERWKILRIASRSELMAFSRRLNYDFTDDSGHISHDSKYYFFDSSGNLQTTVQDWTALPPTWPGAR